MSNAKNQRRRTKGQKEERKGVPRRPLHFFVSSIHSHTFLTKHAASHRLANNTNALPIKNRLNAGRCSVQCFHCGRTLSVSHAPIMTQLPEIGRASCRER